MAVRVLMLLLALIISFNSIIHLVSFIYNVNLYKTHGKAILNGIGILILIIVTIYTALALLGLV